MNPTLAVDLGNTRIHLGFQTLASKKYYCNVPHSDLFKKETEEEHCFIDAILEDVHNSNDKQINFLYASVLMPDKTFKIIQSIKDFITAKIPQITFVEHQITEKTIFKCKEVAGDFEPERLGADRALKFLFAAQQAEKTKKNILVFSFGTAVTCEGVSSTGTILENFIFPGIQMAFNGLNHYTALVPLFQANSKMFSPEGRTWNQEIYVQRGVFLATAAAVLTTIQMHSPCRCYFSGGNSQAIKDLITNELKLNVEEIEIIPFLETEVLLGNVPDFLQYSVKEEEEDSEAIDAIIKTMLQSRSRKKNNYSA